MHHQFLGFFIEEWSSIIVISGGFLSALSWVLSKTLSPLKYAIENLTKTMQEIRKENEKRDKDVEELSDKFSKHLLDAREIKTKVENLEHKVFSWGEDSND
ncbi:MAG: hypothetical protein SOY59_06310 [Ligilactobacillus agilis]|nr:hypothetical protein [Ligilactobacillus agilis]